MTDKVDSILQQLGDECKAEPCECPKCGAQIVGSTYLCEINKTAYQCDNGHMIA